MQTMKKVHVMKKMAFLVETIRKNGRKPLGFF